jgi:hypothetical protein
MPATIPHLKTLTAAYRKLAALLLLLASLPALSSEWIYTVVPGDNLWDFSTRYLDSTLRFESLRKLNGIEFPRRMQPGTRIRVPMAWIRSNPVDARILAIAGTVQLTRAGGDTVSNVAGGTTIQLGDRLSTGAASSVAVQFADGSVITLHQSSEMRFDHLSAHGKTGMVDSRLRLIEGRLDTQVEPAVGPGSRFEIHTPSAISAVRGTKYRAAVLDQRGASAIEVTGGAVAVSGAQRSRLVPEGFGTRVEPAKAPAPPKRLLPPPDAEQPSDPVRIIDIPIEWPAVDGATGYRAEIAADPSFAVVLADERLPGPRLRLPDLPDGTFWVRLRAIGSDGLEGRDRIIQLDMDTHPRPPVPLQPGDGQVFRGTPGQLRWTASEDAAAYLLELAREPAFDDLIERIDGLDGTNHQPADGLVPGTYYWRVTSRASDGELGPPSDPRHWQLKAIPESVEPSIEGDDQGLVASWRAAGDGVRYQAQLAGDKAFSQLLADELLDQPRLGLEPTPGMVRYLRVRVVEDDGYRGPWGAVQRIDPPYDPTVWYVPILGLLGLLLL